MPFALARNFKELPKKTTHRFLIAVILFIALIPAFALAGSVTLPPAITVHNLGIPPVLHSAELFEGAPSYNAEILEEDRYFNAYSVNLTSGVAYSFVVSDFEFALFFLILDASGNILIDSTNAHTIADGMELRLIAPATDSFRIIITSNAGIETGDYTIAVNVIPSFGQISGSVENDSGQALEDILVTAYRQVSTPEGIEYIAELSTETDNFGTFALGPLIPGDYKLSFRDLNFTYGYIYYHQEPALDAADTVTLTSGATINLNTTVMSRAGTITGNVSDESGNALEDILVSAYIGYSEYVEGEFEESIFAISGTETDAAGDFALTGLADGSYFIQFSCPDGLLLAQYYNNVDIVEDATSITLVAGDVREDTDAVMQNASTITGTVTSDMNAPVEDIVVSLLQTLPNVSNPGSFDDFEIVAQDITDDDGTYFFGALVAGMYFLHFSDLEDRFLEMYFEDTFVARSADSFALGNLEHLVGKDVVLIPNSSISGSVVDTSLNSLSGIAVRLFNTAGAPSPITQAHLEEPCHETFTDDFGGFSLSAIIPGSYILQFVDLSGEHSTVFHFGHFDPNTADHITIVPGTHLTDVDAALTPASQISGIITEVATDLALYPAQVFLFESTTNLTPVHTTNTNPDGSFAFFPIGAGTYYLGFTKQGYAMPEQLQFYDNVFGAGNATTLTLDERDHVELDHLLWRNFPQVTLTLNAQNNTPPQIQTHLNGATLNTLPTPVRAGHSFLGWATQAESESLIELPLTLNTNTTLYGQWGVQDITISFDSRGANTIPDVHFSFGQNFGTLPVPVRENYNFMGWFDMPSGGVRIEANTTVTRSMTLYAQWDIYARSITFDSRGGSYVSDISSSFGYDIGALPTPYWSYHTFMGWFDHPNAGARVDENTLVEADTTLYARWQPDRVRVAFDTRGGRTISAQSREVGTRLETLPTPSHPDRVFHRWTLDSSGTTVANANTRIEGNMTLFAQYLGESTSTRILLQYNLNVFRSAWHR